MVMPLASSRWCWRYSGKWFSTGSRRFLRNPSCTFATVSDSGRTDYVSPNGHFSADPTSFTMRSPTMRQFHSSIPWLKYLLFTLHRVGVEPTGFQRMISVHRTSHILRLSLSQERSGPSFSAFQLFDPGFSSTPFDNHEIPNKILQSNLARPVIHLRPLFSQSRIS